MRLPSKSTIIGKDEVTYFSMVSGRGDEVLHQILGRIVVEFGRLEFLVKAAIEKLSRELRVRGDEVPGEEVSFTEGMTEAEKQYTFSKSCRHLEEIFKKWESDPRRAAAFSSFVAHLQEVGKERNAMIHGCWSVSENATFVRLYSRYDSKMASLRQIAERFTIEDLEDFFRLVNHRRYLLAANIGLDIGHVLPLAAPAPPMGLSRSVALMAELIENAKVLGIDRDVLALALGMAAEEIDEVAMGRREIDTKGSEYGRASIVVRLLRKKTLEGDTAAAACWLRREHERLGTTPIEAMQSVEGLLRLSTLSLDD